MVKKIALIGADGFSSGKDQAELRCFPWHRLSSIKNLAEFDDVIINFTSLKHAEKVDWEAYKRIFTVNAMAEILRGEEPGQIILVGDPRQRMPSSETSGPASEARGHSVLEWTKLGLECDDRPGSSRIVRDVPVRFERYLSYLTHWHFSRIGLNPDYEELARAYRVDDMLSKYKNLRLNVELQSYVTSRFSSTLAGELRVTIEELGPYLPDSTVRYAKVINQCGPLVFLPEVNLPQMEALSILLEDACGLSLFVEAPEWVREIRVSGEDELNVKRAEIDAQVAELERKRDAVDGQIAEIRKPLRLLYSQHRDLEEAVRDALKSLGVEVNVSPRSGVEDAWISVRLGEETRYAVIEVKGTDKRTFDEYGLKQLDGWVSDWTDQHALPCKGIFVGNASASQLPGERPNPFGDGFRKKAAAKGRVALLTTDLFRICSLVGEGKLDTHTLWRQIFDTDGIFQLD